MIVFLDTNIVIYAVEQPPVLGPKAMARLTALRARGDSFMVSDLVRMECLVGPLQSGNRVLQNDFGAFFAAPGVQVVPITPAVCDQAALIRATSRFKPMDALQLAAAVEHGAKVFLTNDARLSSFTGLTVEVLT
jgi:predicted nucleic acid-binding protein